MLTDESCMIEGRVAENAIQIENRRIILRDSEIYLAQKLPLQEVVMLYRILKSGKVNGSSVLQKNNRFI